MGTGDLMRKHTPHGRDRVGIFGALRPADLLGSGDYLDPVSLRNDLESAYFQIRGLNCITLGFIIFSPSLNTLPCRGDNGAIKV